MMQMKKLASKVCSAHLPGSGSPEWRF